jgi:hypothetical protein
MKEADAAQTFLFPVFLTHSCDASVTGASDATYHIMWIVLFNALDDFGIREVNDIVRMGSPGTELSNHAQIESIKKKVGDDALHGALRIAGLVCIPFRL